MVKLSVSQAAKLVGVSRVDLQNKINHNQLKTHEGYLTMAALKFAYPEFNPQIEQDKLLARAEKIKENALKKATKHKKISTENQILIDQCVQPLKSELEGLQNENMQLHQIIDELSRKLAFIERHCHHEDKKQLGELQKWLENQAAH